MKIKVEMVDPGDRGPVAHAELHFTDGDLAGLKLIGFSLWKDRTGRLAVTFPARSYVVNGERRSYALLRSIDTHDNEDVLRSMIMDRYRELEIASA